MVGGGEKILSNRGVKGRKKRKECWAKGGGVMCLRS